MSMLSRFVSSGLAVFMLSPGVPRLAAQGAVAAAQSGKPGTPLPRTADGKPNLQGIWQARNRAAYDLQDHAARHGMPAGRGVVEGGEIPYQPWAGRRRSARTSRTARRPIRSRSATCPVFRGSCTWTSRFTSSRRATTSRSPSSGPRSTA